jgi:hypothetical protein
MGQLMIHPKKSVLVKMNMFWSFGLRVFSCERVKNLLTVYFEPAGAACNSVEDLTDTSADRQKLKTILKKFFHRRPTMESIKNSGIYKG